MQIVLLVDLLLHSTVNTQSNDVRIVLACGAAILVVGVLKSLLKLLNFPSCGLLFLIDGVFEVAAQALDLLDLLAQVAAQASQSTDNVILDLARLVSLGERVSVEIFEDASSIGETIVGQHKRRV